ncbi:PREDICTED: transmembrane protein 208-like, partial [Priapulus caudatus]|uniref:Transmembrane protein 208 n=1 Tax=Priapulus caudatus TaxID=37621 RepID=A0ABM1F6B8_PRICU
GSTKGKQATKGQKQIVEENKSTLTFYIYLSVAITVAYLLLTYIFFWDSFTTYYQVLWMLTCAVYAGSYRTMAYMAKAAYSPTGQLLDGGIDLNMEAGFGEHLKDIVLLTAIMQMLTLLSNYFWLIWLLVPFRGFHLLWVNVLGPWFFAPAPEEEISDKKQKKLDRKMKRRQ